MEKATDLPGSSGLNIWEVQDKIRHQEAEFMLSYQMNTLRLTASGIAHEINQPLQIILGRAQNCISDIKQKRIGTEQIIADLELIANTVKRIDIIVNHLQVLSRERKPELKRIDINKGIENSLIMFRQQLKNRGIKIELDLKHDLPLIRADMVQLEQVFINLINNARDSFEEKEEDRKIMISSQLNNNQIQIIFRDNGKGIAPENIQQKRKAQDWDFTSLSILSEAMAAQLLPGAREMKARVLSLTCRFQTRRNDHEPQKTV